MTDMTPFAFEDHLVRVFVIDGEPWWVARDVCKAIGIQKPENAYARIPDDEKGTHQAGTLRDEATCQTGTLGDEGIGLTEIPGEEGVGAMRRPLGGQQPLVIVSEPGLYRLIFRSDKPAAERFRTWVFHEVLPAIRRTGRFEMPGAAEREEAERPDIGPTGDLNTRLRLVEVSERLAGRAAARRMWERLGLPAIDDAPAGEPGPHDPTGLDHFLSERCAYAPGLATATLALHAAYAAFAAAAGLPAASVTALGRALSARGLMRRKGRGGPLRPTEWVGIGLKGGAA